LTSDGDNYLLRFYRYLFRATRTRLLYCYNNIRRTRALYYGTCLIHNAQLASKQRLIIINTLVADRARAYLLLKVPLPGSAVLGAENARACASTPPAKRPKQEALDRVHRALDARPVPNALYRVRAFCPARTRARDLVPQKWTHKSNFRSKSWRLIITA